MSTVDYKPFSKKKKKAREEASAISNAGEKKICQGKKGGQSIRCLDLTIPVTP